MNLRGIIPLKADQIKLGHWVWLNEENAALFSIPYQFAESEYNLPNGIYVVTEIIPRKPDLSQPLTLQIVAEVIIHHHTWDPLTDPGLNIVYNINSHAITIDHTILVDDALYPVFRSRKEFDQANIGRVDCISCGNPLNIISMNLRICAQCEDILDRPSTANKEPTEEL